MKEKKVKLLNKKALETEINEKYIELTITTFSNGKVTFDIRGFLYSTQIEKLKPFHIMQYAKGGIHVY